MKTMPTSRSFCTFHLENLYLGVEVLSVQEVIRFQKMTRIPLAPPKVRGLMNLRGQIVTAIDLRQQLELSELPDGATPMNVVVRTPDGPVSLLVDRISDVIDVEEGQLEPPPETLSPTIRNIVDGIYKLDNRLLLTLNIERLLHTSEPLPVATA